MKLSFKIKKDVQFVFDTLSDMQKFVTVHPVIFQVDPLGEQNYLVHETLKFGPLPFTFTYPVSIEKNINAQSIVMRASVFKLTKIEMNFILKAEGDFTIVEEEIKFKSPLPVKGKMQRIFKKQHVQLFKNIELK